MSRLTPRRGSPPPPRAAPPGSTSTPRPRPTASSLPAGLSAPPASPASPSAGHRPPHRPARAHLRRPGRGRAGYPGGRGGPRERGGEPRAPWGLRGGGGTSGSRPGSSRPHPLERAVGGKLSVLGGWSARGASDLPRGRPRAASELSCQAQLVVDQSPRPGLEVAPCYTGSDGDPEELAALRSTPRLARHGARAELPRPAAHLRPRLRRRPQLLEGSLRPRAPDELIDTLIERMTLLGRPLGEILIESLHGAPKDVDPDSAALGYRDAAFNVSVMASWTDLAHDDEGIAWARETAAPRSSPTRSAAATPTTCRPTSPRPRARRLRPRLIRPPPIPQIPLRPGKRPAPQPERPAGGLALAEHALAEVLKGHGELVARRRCPADARPARAREGLEPRPRNPPR